MKRLLALLLILPAAQAWASPDLGSYRDIQGVRLYRDHQNRQLWYLAPAPPALGTREDGEPDYGLDLFRYLGRKGTGDQGSFWLRGMLSLGIVRERSPDITAPIRRALQSAGFHHLRLRSMPVATARVRLLFADQMQSWTQGSRWGSRQLRLSLDRDMAELLWDAVEAGQTLVSLAVEEHLAGLRHRDGEWEEAETIASWTIPIQLDMEAYPGRFRRTELGGRMSKGYTGIDVFCFDFVENLDTNLYAKIVEVAIPTAGRDLVERVTFRESSDYRARIEFKLAKNLDEPYRVRVIKIFKDGRRSTTPWSDKGGESLLDVTAYRDPETSSVTVDSEAPSLE
ncbi:MAG: hypothetical protein ACLFVT_01440 [Syntrophobacteria bacterium]